MSLPNVSIPPKVEPKPKTEPKSETQVDTLPDPRRRTREPQLQHTDELFNSITPFQWPSAINKDWADLAESCATAAADGIERIFSNIADVSAKAYQQVVEDFQTTWAESLRKMNADARKVVLDDTEKKADAASRQAQQQAEEIAASSLKNLEAKIDEELNVAANILNIYPTAASMLTGTTIGPAHDEDFDRYSRRLQHADYVTMRTMASKALSSGNRAFQAAVCEKLATMNKPPITARDFAHRVLGTDHDRLRAVVLQLKDIKIGLQNRRLEAMRRKTSLVRKIEAGLRAKAIGDLKSLIEDEDGE